MLQQGKTHERQFSLADDVILSYDHEFRILNVSPNVEDKLGYKPEELIGKAFQDLDIFASVNQEKAAADASKVLSGEAGSTIYQLKTKDGRRKYGEVISLSLIQQGQVAAGIIVAREIIENHKDVEFIRKHRDNLELLVKERTSELMKANERLKQEILEHIKLERALRISEEKYRILVDNANEAIFIEQDDRLKFVNPKSEEILGYSREELTSMPFDHLIHPDDREDVLKRYEKWMAGKRHDEIYSFRIKGKSGNTKHVQINAVPVPWEGRNACLTFATDITERVKMEEQIRLSEQKFSAAFHANPTPMVITALDTGKIIEINDSTSIWSGYTHEELLAHTTCELGYWSDKNEREAFLKELFENGAMDSQEKRIRIKNNECRHVVFSSRLIEIHGKTYVLSQLLDITKRKKAEEELRRYQDHLESLVKERTSELMKAVDRLEQEIDVRRQSESALTAREAELEVNRQELEEMNSALKVILKQRDRDRADIEENVLRNINETVLIYLDRLSSSRLTEKQRECLSEAYSNLKNITSSFVKELSSDYFGLSPKEIQVASLVEGGRSSKEIAEFLNVSLNTVIFHRHNIRRKTGLKKKKVNLSTYLKTLRREHP
jgi:PAS domain S-box-containing protein